MPGYTKVSIYISLNAVKGQIEQAKTQGTYAGNEAHWDQQVVAALDADCKRAERYVAENADLVKGKRDHCKERIDAIETLLKKTTLEEKDYSAIKLWIPTIKKFTDEIHADNRLLNDALKDEYRGAWPVEAKKLLQNKTLTKPYEDARKSGIDAGKGVVAMTTRCDEYVVRATEFLKQALQKQKQGGVDVAEFKQDMAEIKSKMEANKQAIDDLIYQRQRDLKWFLETLDKKKEKDYTADDLKEAKSRLSTIATSAKEARGKLKTMTVEREGLEKRAKASGPGWKEPALKAVKEAATAFGLAEKAVNGLTDKEKKCEGLLKKVQGKVK